MSRHYLRTFQTESAADDWMRAKNRASRDGTVFVLVDGPADDFAVMDLTSAIESDFSYRWGV